MIAKFRRAYCTWFGHVWSRWSPWELEGFGLRHDRTCRRCRALEVQRDGEEGIIHACSR